MSRHSTKWTPGLRIRTVQPLRGFWLRLTYSDGSIREIDLDPYLHGPVFDPMRSDRQFFKSVRIYPEGETIYWPNGADIAPETLYEASSPVQDHTEPSPETTDRKRIAGKSRARSSFTGRHQTTGRRTKQAKARRS